jgi:hypothetical protein
MNTIITREQAADMIASYLHHEVTIAQLVDWSENAIMDANFAEQDISVLSRVLSRIGLADVRAFGLTWEDCEDMLKQLGFATHVDVVAV